MVALIQWGNCSQHLMVHGPQNDSIEVLFMRPTLQVNQDVPLKKKKERNNQWHAAIKPNRYHSIALMNKCLHL